MKDGVRYHHIIDPASGDSARELRSVTIIGPDATTTDALSTSVFVLGLQKGMDLVNQLPGIDAILVDANGRLHYSEELLPAKKPDDSVKAYDRFCHPLTTALRMRACSRHTTTVAVSPQYSIHFLTSRRHSDGLPCRDFYRMAWRLPRSLQINLKTDTPRCRCHPGVTHFTNRM